MDRENAKRADNTKMPSGTKILWDVAVIGGGAAGMMAAAKAAAILSAAGSKNPRVILLEKNSTLGKKLLITGGGRCNVTNAEFDTRKFLAKFSRTFAGKTSQKSQRNDQFLFSAFAKFGVQDSLDFFNSRGMETKVEALQRVFPVSDSAQSVWDVLVHEMQKYSVTVRTRQSIEKWIVKKYSTDEKAGTQHPSTSQNESHIHAVRLVTGEEIRAKNFILATGGKSRPETGSTGDGFNWLKEFGHTISESGAALVPLTLKDSWAKDLAGVTLDGIQLTVFQEGAKQRKVRGKILFTHKGITGPTILNLSREIGESLKYGPVTISLDLLPDVTREVLGEKLHALLKERSNKLVKNVLSDLVPNAIVAPLLMLAEIPEDTFSHSLTREKRIALVGLFKNLPLHVKGLLGLDKAVITSGGVALTEVDFRTMRSRLISNLYIVGDLLNLDRPSGGYSLQLCWTTGAVAGMSAADSSALHSQG
jgi:predicted Rossmann fold flavoprotein